MQPLDEQEDCGKFCKLVKLLIQSDCHFVSIIASSINDISSKRTPNSPNNCAVYFDFYYYVSSSTNTSLDIFITSKVYNNQSFKNKQEKT